jgi:hypothetical protein
VKSAGQYSFRSIAIFSSGFNLNYWHGYIARPSANRSDSSFATLSFFSFVDTVTHTD